MMILVAMTPTTTHTHKDIKRSERVPQLPSLKTKQNSNLFVHIMIMINCTMSWISNPLGDDGDNNVNNSNSNDWKPRREATAETAATKRPVSHRTFGSTFHFV